MSGLFGIYRFDDAPVLPEQLQAMSQAMAYYGEDGGGIWRGPGVGLGSLLRHVTPEDAFESQPLCSEGNVLVATGRLDNREELCAAFGLSQPESAALPDSAFILRAYQRWGEDCVDHLLGDWSFAVWDAAQQRLLIARDHHGNTALYYHQDAHRLAFASNLKALRALSDTPQRPDFLKVAQILVSWPGDGIRTAYEDLRALPPAHLLQVVRTGAEPRRYWFPETQPPLELPRDEDYLEQFLDIYGQAVRARLRSSKPIGATLSAGLDSGSVVALAGPMLAEQGQSLTAFTAVPFFDNPKDFPPGRLGNEWELAHATALRAGVSIHLPVRVEHGGLLESIQRQVEIHGVPGHAGANYHWMLALMEEARDRGLGALLTGQTGNATISYTGGASLWWPNMIKGEVRKAWRALHDSEPNPWLAFKRQVLKPVLLPQIQAYRRLRNFGIPPWSAYSAIHPELARELKLGSRMAQEGHDPSFSSATHAMNLEILALGRHDGGGIWHELGAALRLEVRDPTADRRVIEFCLRCPDSQYRHRGQDRQLIRRAMAGRMPQEVLHATIRGLQAADLGSRVLADRPALARAMESFEDDSLIAHCLDLPRMARILDQISPGMGQVAYLESGSILLRGLGVGFFLHRIREGTILRPFWK